MTEAEYLAFEAFAATKHEFVNGELVAMSGVSEAHPRLQANLIIQLGTRLRGGPCRVNVSDLRGRIDETGLYAYPDLTVVCGRAELSETSPPSLLNPRVVIEVLSESTENYDRGAKAAHYRHRASVETILLVDSRRRMVERQDRNADGTWTLAELTSGTVGVLDVVLTFDEIYADVELRG